MRRGEEQAYSNHKHLLWRNGRRPQEEQEVFAQEKGWTARVEAGGDQQRTDIGDIQISRDETGQAARAEGVEAKRLVRDDGVAGTCRITAIEGFHRRLVRDASLEKPRG